MRIHLQKRNQKKIVSGSRSESLAASTITLCQVVCEQRRLWRVCALCWLDWAFFICQFDRVISNFHAMSQVKCFMKLCQHECDNIPGKPIEYAIPMLVILAENAFHVVGFNLFNSIFRVGFGVRLDCTDII